MQLELVNLERGHDLCRETVQCSRISINLIYTGWLSGQSGGFRNVQWFITKKRNTQKWGKVFFFQKKVEVTNNMASVTQHWTSWPFLLHVLTLPPSPNQAQGRDHLSLQNRKWDEMQISIKLFLFATFLFSPPGFKPQAVLKCFKYIYLSKTISIRVLSSWPCSYLILYIHQT